MIVREIMTTKLVSVEPDDTLSHAANLFRQYQFHHLPVARTIQIPIEQKSEYHHVRRTHLLLEGMLTAQDIDMAAAVANQNDAGTASTQNWQDRRVLEVMHRALIRVMPTTSVAAAAQILVERGLNYLPVVEYEQTEHETRTVLVGLLTRSDLLMALARAMGAFEPGMQMDIALPLGNMVALADTIRIASEMHVQIRSLIAAPMVNGVPHMATLRLGTINPAPFLTRLQEAGIQYSFANHLTEE